MPQIPWLELSVSLECNPAKTKEYLQCRLSTHNLCLGLIACIVLLTGYKQNFKKEQNLAIRILLDIYTEIKANWYRINTTVFAYVFSYANSPTYQTQFCVLDRAVQYQNSYPSLLYSGWLIIFETGLFCSCSPFWERLSCPAITVRLLICFLKPKKNVSISIAVSARKDCLGFT